MARARPWPTPTHMVARPNLPPDFSSWCSAVWIRRAPLAPSGWPRAMAPPLGLTLSLSSAMPSSRITARPCAAKASFSSMTSKSPMDRFRRSISLRTAGTGPMPITRGATPALAMPSTFARGVRPCFFTASADARIRATAPSFTPEALPAVTVLPSPLTGFSLARASRVVSGRRCSSRSTTVSPFLPLITTGTISSAKKPSAWARPARCWLRRAKRSWSARETW
ncbi:hypothetical protein D9M68_635140 [compost metagenome]